MTHIYSIHKPEKDLPLIFDSPHSGQDYPADFAYICSRADLERAEDKYVDDLFSCAPSYGGTLLLAHFPRSYIDVNRAIDDIDLDLIEGGHWPADLYGPIAPSARSDAGIGLIRRLIRPGVPLYGAKLSAEMVHQRINDYYIPYHKKLEELIETAHFNFGESWHINCHSMPDSSARPRMPVAINGLHARNADFVIGDRDGSTASLHFTHALRDFLKGLGYTVTINDPYKGVELIRRYSNPARGRHSVQIEINKALYMNEETREKTRYYNELKDNIQKMVDFVSTYASAQLIPRAAD